MVLNKYAAFARVAEYKNITRAANEMNYTQSAISHSIRNLEDELGVPLIFRTRNGIELTDYGKELLPYINKLLKLDDTVHQKASQFAGIHKGTIKVGAFTSVSMFWIPPVARRIQEEYPDVKFIQSHSGYGGVEKDLITNNVDVGFLSDKFKEDLDFIPLFRDEYLVIIPPDHVLATYERVPLEALEHERLILMDEQGEYDTVQILKQLNHPEVVHYVNEDFLAIPLVENGMGISVLPRLIMDCVETSAAVKKFAEPKYRTIGLAALSFRDPPPLVALFVKLIKEYIEKWQESYESIY